MNDLESARDQFFKAGLVFPTLPPPLALALVSRARWCYSTRALPINPYAHQFYIEEACEERAPEYAIVAHGGHGTNSYALHHYLVHRKLSLFVKVAWGGDPRDQARATRIANQAIELADRLVVAAQMSPRLAEASDRLVVVASDCTPSLWRPPGGVWLSELPGVGGMFDTLAESTAWLERLD